MSYVIVIQDPDTATATLVGPFDTVEAAQEYLTLHVEAFISLEHTLAEEWEGEGDIPPLKAFISYMNAP